MGRIVNFLDLDDYPVGAAFVKYMINESICSGPDQGFFWIVDVFHHRALENFDSLERPWLECLFVVGPRVKDFLVSLFFVPIDIIIEFNCRLFRNMSRFGELSLRVSSALVFKVIKMEPMVL